MPRTVQLLLCESCQTILKSRDKLENADYYCPECYDQEIDIILPSPYPEDVEDDE